MSTPLELHDIQGSIVKAYGRYGFPKSRYIFYRIRDGKKGREVVKGLLPMITTSIPWPTPKDVPPTTVNIAFTYEGLKRLGLPELSLHSFPDEFAMGMRARHDILGDVGRSDPDKWDPIWQSKELEQPVHMLVWISGNGLVDGKPAGKRDIAVDRIEACYQEIETIVEQSAGGVELLCGHRGEGDDDLPYQDGSALYDKQGQPTSKEHFGYNDGISEPYFKGCGARASSVVGGGKPTGKDPTTDEGWEALETGEFILGHKDEAFEYPKAPVPSLLAKNGTFMVYRKLHENVAAFNQYMSDVGATFPGGPPALEAKFVGRWKNGAPITTYPTLEEAEEFMKDYQAAQAEARDTETADAKARYAELRKKFVAFDYNDDLPGSRCPVGAHTRRANPRGALEFGQSGAYDTPGALVNRRRIIRRGIPYGVVDNPASNEGNHGVIFVVLNANINRQFEFVQQQWMNYGNDFKLANDQDPILGNHNDQDGKAIGRMIVEADPNGDQPPHFCSKIPTFVETRGGDYFFIPSLTAVRMIGDGVIDPT